MDVVEVVHHPIYFESKRFINIGYLTHDEFRKMIRAMGVKLTDVQISEVQVICGEKLKCLLINVFGTVGYQWGG